MVASLRQTGDLSTALRAIRDEARANAWAERTKATYQTAWNSWARFCDAVSQDPLAIDAYGNLYSMDDLEDLVTYYVTLECGIRGLAPDSIYKTYLPGVASRLDLCRSPARYDFRRATQSIEVKLVVRGFNRSYERNKPKADKNKMPYCMDLAARSRASMRQRRAFSKDGARLERILQKRAYVAQVVGIQFMLRKSEHMQTKGATAATCTRRHVTFLDDNSRPIPHQLVGMRKAHWVILNIPFAKCDASGYGRRTRHARQEDSPDLCVVCVLEDWFMDTRDNFGATEDQALYEVRGAKTFSADALHRVMQWAVEDATPAGQEKKRVTSHSLRYGGATMMAAAGFPMYIIAIYGGWALDSESLKIYTRPSEQMANLVSAHMVAMAKTDAATYFINDAFVIAKARSK